MPETPLARPGDVVAIASDHAGVELKAALLAELTALGFKPLDLGTNSPDSVGYPDFGHALARAILDKKAAAGVAICGTGIGISIAANRHAGIRAGLAHDENTARLAREHNDANVLALGARVVNVDLAKQMLRAFFATPFGGGRHGPRVAKLG
ncbi:MAG: ribose 5-phosphate isomerase B [Rhodospirillaceae bacterium]|nr:ribose 5-phosphate isomerase B [Rhodospirillaceae bacterium]